MHNQLYHDKLNRYNYFLFLWPYSKIFDSCTCPTSAVILNARWAFLLGNRLHICINWWLAMCDFV